MNEYQSAPQPAAGERTPPLRWGQSVAAHGTGPDARLEVDVMVPGADEPQPMELSLADAKVLHAQLGDIIGDLEAPDGTATARLAEIRARTAAASDGPWDTHCHAHIADGCRCLCDWDPVVGWQIETLASLDCDDLVAQRSVAGELNDFRRPLRSCGEGPLLTWEDAEFAARARDDIPFLLALLDEQRPTD